ncbi:hypothetical protein BT63DRAFT_428750 [Microthyrium microscopicum]|uniref:SnoaL-like domain-containing protein n=1 Tax=Microthyrium microscopicum TaxID=703497 RepID=A0A6A6U3G9_9PEZI|nr:hypothetical protein BT63DRAFT_428750 [Microthyrium microscopicum]
MAPILTNTEAEAWLQGFYDMADKLEAVPWFEQYSTEDTEIQYANLPLMTGKDALNMYIKVFGNLDRLAHSVKHFDVVGDRILHAVTVRYVVKGDDPDKDVIEIGAFSECHLRRDEVDGKVKCARADIYVDPSPVFQRVAAKGL